MRRLRVEVAAPSIILSSGALLRSAEPNPERHAIINIQYFIFWLQVLGTDGEGMGLPAVAGASSMVAVMPGRYGVG